jgi:GTP-binding protein
VILEADEGLGTLLDFRYRRHYAAPRGRHGEGSDRHGASGDDLILRVPVGTTVRQPEPGLLLGDLTRNGERLEVARGGRGGRGNARFATSTNRAPRRADPGEAGEERTLRLELRLLADVGVVGFPNAGKSTLVSRLSAARPKIADYPFTTLVPTLGLVRLDEGRSFVLADVPGLIPGAAEGKGLGLRFLRHLERTRLLVHLLDLDPATGRDPVEDWKTIQAELRAYSPELAARPQLIAANKIDLEGAAPRLKRVVAMGRRRRLPVFPLAARTGQGLAELRAALGTALLAPAADRTAGAPA